MVHSFLLFALADAKYPRLMMDNSSKHRAWLVSAAVVIAGFVAYRTMPGLRAELADARAEVRDLREDRDQLRRRLQRDLGEQVDARSKRELLERLRVLEQENSQLQDTLRTTTTELASATRERDTAVADLEGTQLALRQTMRQVTMVR